ncbi:MAG: response regulator transcription factor [Limnohabitans sp.]|nr:response regulator transcription factor [Limnohabitans sp.]
MIFRCMIVDDEPLAHRVLEKYFSIIPNITIVHQAYNAKEAGFFLENNSIDILLLDINMPEITGIEFLQSLTNKPLTIFTTALRNHALDGYELGVFDYLLKPIKEERFQLAIDRAVEILNLKSQGQQIENHTSQYITIRSNGMNIRLNTNEITHIQGLKDYTILYANPKKYMVKGSIKSMFACLPEEQFVRVHKSFIVSKTKLNAISNNKIEFDGFQIPIGRKFKDIKNFDF